MNVFRDLFGNVIEHTLSAMATSLILPDGNSAIRPKLTLSVSSSLFNRYSYMPSAIGLNALVVAFADGFGLWATYYSPGLTGAYLSRADSSIDFSSNSSALGRWPGIQSSFMSVRWTGFFRPPSNGSYSFQTYLLENNCRVRLYFDNNFVLDQWSSLAALQPIREVGLLDSSQYYFIIVEYTRTGFAPSFGIQLRSAHDNGTFTPVVSTSLYLQVLAEGSPFAVEVFGGYACATTSILTGASVSLMTAGVTSMFTLAFRDSFGNPAAPLSPTVVLAYARYPDPPVLDFGKVLASIPIQNGSEFQIDGGNENLTTRMYNALAGKFIEIGGEGRIVTWSSPNGYIFVAVNFTTNPEAGAPYTVLPFPILQVDWASVIPTGFGKSLRLIWWLCCNCIC